MATAGALEDQELMSEGKNLSFERCSSLKACRAEENSERMIVSMSPKSYSDGCLNATSSVRTEFLVGTSSEFTTFEDALECFTHSLWGDVNSASPFDSTLRLTRP